MKTIVWDLDDVLNGFTEAWFKQAWLVEHPECRLTFDQLRSNPPLEELHVPLAEYLESLDRFRLSAAARELRPQPTVMAWFEREGGQFRHHVLTARPAKTVGAGAAWVFDHFGRWIRDFHYVPSPRPTESLPAYDATKADVLARLGTVDFLVDDSPSNVAAAWARGIRSFVFPQPWNHAEKTVTQILMAFSQDSAETGFGPIRFQAVEPQTESATTVQTEPGTTNKRPGKPSPSARGTKARPDSSK